MRTEGRFFPSSGPTVPVMKRIAIAVWLIAGIALLSAAAAGSVAGAQADAETNASADASFGAEVSSFMQASSAEAEGEVNDRMFVAALERTDDPEQRRALVEEREDELAERRERLRDRQERLNEIRSEERRVGKECRL